MLLGAGGGFTAGTYTGTRGVTGGGQHGIGDGYNSNLIFYITIQSTGNTSDFGNLTSGRMPSVGASNGTRGLFMAGARRRSISGVHDNYGWSGIDYVTIASTGNATNFGSVSNNNVGTSAGASNGDRATRAGGVYLPTTNYSSQDQIDYVSIATTGNATDLADLTDARSSFTGCSDGIYGYYGGGNKITAYYGVAGPYTNVNTHNIATTGNCTTHGSLTPGRQDENQSSCGSNNRLLWWGGIQQYNILNNSYNPTIRYQTAGTTTSNSSTFGDLSYRRSRISCVNDQNRAVGVGGHYSGDSNDRQVAGTKIDYVTIATTANATSFGTVTSSHWQSGYTGQSTQAGCSGS